MNVVLMYVVDNEVRGCNFLGWVSCEKIVLGMVRVLVYLDKLCVRMLYGDIKLVNILLNREYEFFVVDYGFVYFLDFVSVSLFWFIGYKVLEVIDICKFMM